MHEKEDGAISLPTSSLEVIRAFISLLVLLDLFQRHARPLGPDGTRCKPWWFELPTPMDGLLVLPANRAQATPSQPKKSSATVQELRF